MPRADMDANHVSVVIPSLIPRFTLNEWHHNNQFRYRCSEAQQESSDRLLADSTRACDLATEIVKTNKEKTDHQLREKINDIEFRRGELLWVRKDIVLEIDALLTYKERIVNTLKSVKRNALTICEKCLTARERRLSVDLVHDKVEKKLLEERGMIQKAESSLGRILGEICEQIRKLKATLYHIDRDLENKECNLYIDRRNIVLKETDFDLNTSYSTSCLDKSVIKLNEWELQTNNNVVSANKEVNDAKRLRSFIDTIIKQTIDDLNRQKDVTNGVFRQRIEQTQEAKAKLEFQHSEIVKQITAMSSNITLIKKSIADKEGYMALAHTRLEYRCQRPETEATQDPVEANLVKEIRELRNIVANLQQTLCEAETQLRYLLKTQIQLEEDINVKTNTLKIDEVECMTLRQSLDYHAY
ncbi:tektin-1 [Linepithema humile]|uniref:tektin-1 n=1 Tax=Linepithema humile TaxID=83485 RepID=UPI00351F6D23